jgi:serine/threonine-protein kinase
LSWDTETRSSARGDPRHLDEEELAGLALGDLSGDAHARALAHLESCERCRRAATLVQRGERTGPPVDSTEPALDLAEALGDTRLKDPLVGTRLGEYEVTGVLASGGMGVIYTGVQPLIGRKVAIKVLLPAFAADEGVIERLLGEARALAAIRHPNIVDVFSFGQTAAGQHYFVMDFLEGETLSTLLRRERRVHPHHVLTLLDAVLAGLDAAHRAGVLHRDLKPGNIFLMPLADGSVHVKLLDFGLAKTMGGVRRTALGLVLGTPGFMAPEQIADQPVSPATDLYAVGVIAFALLTGKNPFPVHDQREVMMAHLEKVPPRVASLVAGLPEGLDALVAQLLEKRPSDRPASAPEVRRELQRIRRLSESAPTERELQVTPLSGMVKVRAFPQPEGVGQETKSDRPPVLPEPQLANSARWKWWAIGGALVATGFGLGLVLARPSVSRAEVEARLKVAHAEAEALRLEGPRTAALKDLDALQDRLAAGAPPLQISRDLEEQKQTHGLK